VIDVGKAKKNYSPRFQFQVVLEALKGDRKEVEIARAYGIHPTTISNWKREFLEKGPELFCCMKMAAMVVQRLTLKIVYHLGLWFKFILQGEQLA